MKWGVDLELCRLAFENRSADAHERSALTMSRLVAAARTASRRGNEAEMRAITKSITALTRILAKYGRRNLKPDGEGPTAELLLQVRKGRKGDPLLRLAAHDKITMDQLRWAREIGAIVYGVSRHMLPKITKLPVKGEDPGVEAAAVRWASATDAAEYMALLHCFVYLPWADRVSPDDLKMLLAVIVDGDSINAVARRQRRRHGAVIEKMRDALNLYGQIKRRYRKVGAGATPRRPRPGSVFGPAAP